jgi:hypothetical protein
MQERKIELFASLYEFASAQTVNLHAIKILFFGFKFCIRAKSWPVTNEQKIF